MASKKRKAAAASRPGAQPTVDKPATLADLLNADTVSKLKHAAEAMKAEEAGRREAERHKAEEAKKAEQKRLENDFSHLLNNSKLDWKKYK